MKQPDNHIDELDRILGELGVIVESGKNQHGSWKHYYIDYDGQLVNEDEIVKSTKQKINQYYADFYRNKIPKKLPKDSNEFSPTFIQAWNRAIDDITAQFNSKGDNDE